MKKSELLKEVTEWKKDRRKVWRLVDAKTDTFLKPAHTVRYSRLKAIESILHAMTDQEYKDLLERARDRYRQHNTKQLDLL